MDIVSATSSWWMHTTSMETVRPSNSLLISHVTLARLADTSPICLPVEPVQLVHGSVHHGMAAMHYTLNWAPSQCSRQHSRPHNAECLALWVLIYRIDRSLRSSLFILLSANVSMSPGTSVCCEDCIASSWRQATARLNQSTCDNIAALRRGKCL